MSIKITVAPDVKTMPRQAGEGQSTVIRPKLKNSAPNGRFLASIDTVRPPQRGTVVAHDLRDPTHVIESSFASIAYGGCAPIAPIGGTYCPVDANHVRDCFVFCTNDHDLVALPNGDILLLMGAFSREPLAPQPAWFDVTYRGGFGPGARYVVEVWRSEDGGDSFRFVSRIDPARIGDGSGAFPQLPELTTPPGSPTKPVYDMGGSDGQLVYVDQRTGVVYMTFPCVGYQVAQTNPFKLNKDARLNKTLVLASYDSGTNWTHIATVPIQHWRFGMAALSANRLYFGAYNMLFIGRRNAQGVWTVDEGRATPTGAWGWDNFGSPEITKAQQFIYANSYSHTLTIGSYWSSHVALAYPDTIIDSGGRTRHGYRLFYYSRATDRFHEVEPILPVTATPNNWIMHMAVIDCPTPQGAGLALLYWYDMSADKMSGIVRGRIIGDGGLASETFAISRTANAPRSFNLDQGPISAGYWYGDYRTGGGYVDVFPEGGNYYSFFPMWVEPDGTIRYTEVSVHHDPTTASASVFTDDGVKAKTVDLSEFDPGPQEHEKIREHLGEGTGRVR